MPGGDRTGPMGAGPMTGRGAGYCTGYNVPGYANPGSGAGYGGGYGRGQGRGGGRSRGRGWGYAMTGMPGWARGGYAPPVAPYAPPAPMAYDYDPANDLKALQNQAKFMKKSLDEINQRIEELQQRTEESK